MLMEEMEARILAMAERLAEVEADRDALYERVSELEVMLVAKLSNERARRLLGIVADEFGLTVDEIISPCREAALSRARFAFSYLARSELNIFQRIIARVIECDPTAVSFGIRRAKEMIVNDDEFRAKVNKIRARLREWAGDPLTNLPLQPDEPLTGHPSNGVPQRHVIASGDGVRV